MNETSNDDERTEGDPQSVPVRIGNNAGAAQEGRAERPIGNSMRRGARVTLQRFNGEYRILRGSVVIQGFCSDFETITQFSLPDGIQQQVRINISPVEPAREIPAEDPPGEDRDDPGVELRSTSHPHALRLSPESLERMEVEIPESPRSSDWRDYAREQLLREMRQLEDILNMLDRSGRT